MKKTILTLLLIFMIGLSSAQFKQRTGANHEVEVTIKRAGLGNLIQAKWMNIEEDLNNSIDGLFGDKDDKKPEKWAS